MMWLTALGFAAFVLCKYAHSFRMRNMLTICRRTVTSRCLHVAPVVQPLVSPCVAFLSLRGTLDKICNETDLLSRLL
jgi:hypothetical protein